MAEEEHRAAWERFNELREQLFILTPVSVVDRRHVRGRRATVYHKLVCKRGTFRYDNAYKQAAFKDVVFQRRLVSGLTSFRHRWTWMQGLMTSSRRGSKKLRKK